MNDQPPSLTPPSGPSPDQPREKIVEYVRAHRDRFTPEALRAELLGAGYQSGEIEEALAAEGSPQPAAGPIGRDLRPRAAGIVLVAYVGTFVAFSQSNLPHSYFGDSLLSALLGMLTLACFLSLAIVGWSRRLERGESGALVATLALPFVLLVLVSGLCIPGALGPRYN